MESRRGFFKKLFGAAMGAVALELDPEQLLWTPGAKTIVDLGARPALERATLDDVQVYDAATAAIRARISEMGGLATVLTERQIYSPNRFTLTTSHGDQMTFDTDFRPTSQNGRRLSDTEAVAMLRKMADRETGLRVGNLWQNTPIHRRR